METAKSFLSKYGPLIMVALALVYFGAREYQRSKWDERIEAATIKAERASAVYEEAKNRLRPANDSLKQRIAKLEDFKSQQSIKNILTAKKNEALNKQLDSINSVVGIRPDF